MCLCAGGVYFYSAIVIIVFTAGALFTAPSPRARLERGDGFHTRYSGLSCSVGCVSFVSAALLCWDEWAMMLLRFDLDSANIIFSPIKCVCVCWSMMH